MICITIYVQEVRVFLVFADFCISYFEVTLVGAYVSFVHFLSLVHDGLIWMVHELFHSIFYSNKIRLFWFIRISTAAHCEILKIIAGLDSGVHESTNPVIWLSYM